MSKNQNSTKHIFKIIKVDKSQSSISESKGKDSIGVNIINQTTTSTSNKNLNKNMFKCLKNVKDNNKDLFDMSKDNTKNISNTITKTSTIKNVLESSCTHSNTNSNNELALKEHLKEKVLNDDAKYIISNKGMDSIRNSCFDKSLNQKRTDDALSYDNFYDEKLTNTTHSNVDIGNRIISRNINQSLQNNNINHNSTKSVNKSFIDEIFNSYAFTESIEDYSLLENDYLEIVKEFDNKLSIYSGISKNDFSKLTHNKNGAFYFKTLLYPTTLDKYNDQYDNLKEDIYDDHKKYLESQITNNSKNNKEDNLYFNEYQDDKHSYPHEKEFKSPKRESDLLNASINELNKVKSFSNSCNNKFYFYDQQNLPNSSKYTNLNGCLQSDSIKKYSNDNFPVNITQFECDNKSSFNNNNDNNYYVNEENLINKADNNSYPPIPSVNNLLTENNYSFNKSKLDNISYRKLNSNYYINNYNKESNRKPSISLKEETKKNLTEKSFAKSIVYQNEDLTKLNYRSSNTANIKSVELDDSKSESMSFFLKNNNDFFSHDKNKANYTINSNNNNNNNVSKLKFKEVLSKEDVIFFTNLSNKLNQVESYDNEIQKNYPQILKEICRKLT